MILKLTYEKRNKKRNAIVVKPVWIVFCFFKQYICSLLLPHIGEPRVRLYCIIVMYIALVFTVHLYFLLYAKPKATTNFWCRSFVVVCLILPALIICECHVDVGQGPQFTYLKNIHRCKCMVYVYELRVHNTSCNCVSRAFTCSYLVCVNFVSLNWWLH